jgi:D-glycero-D-manno-heptose 1,7-bisphosphate phosphatase
LDRDGVLIRDTHLVSGWDQVEILPGVRSSLRRLVQAGWTLVVVTNQTVVARGLASEQDVARLHERLNQELGGWITRFCVCPHHPHADVPAYRQICDCRKPGPGLLIRAARDLGLDLSASIMVGDRPTDVAAGLRAGCRSIWVQTGRHRDAPLVSDVPVLAAETALCRVADLPAAVDYILANP